MAELTYTKVGDYYIPDLALDPESAEPVRTVGKYGSLRRSYLKQHKHDLWRELAGSGKIPLITSLYFFFSYIFSINTAEIAGDITPIKYNTNIHVCSLKFTFFILE